MFRLTIKNYLLHIPYSVLLIIQMLIVLFITNHTLIQVIRDSKTLDNVVVNKELYLVENNQDDKDNFIKDVKKLVGENCVGYMYSDISVGIDKIDYREVPSLEYINTTMEKVQYILKEGHWFTNEDNQIILGEQIAEIYNVGDEVVLTKDGKKKKVVVAGILKNPGQCIHLDKNADGNLCSLMNQGWGAMLTNSVEILEWMGTDSNLEAVSLIVNVEGKKSAIELLKNRYKVTSLEQAKENGKIQIRKDVIGNGMYMMFLLVMAFVGVSIQIYMYFRRNQKEYQLYRMLGLGYGGIFVLWCGQHIINLAMVVAAFFSFCNFIVKRKVFNSKITDGNTVLFLTIYCLVYIMLIIFVYMAIVKKWRRRYHM